MIDSAPVAPPATAPRTLVVVDALFRNGATRVTLSLLERWGPGSHLAVLTRPADAAVLPPPDGAPVVHLSRPGQRQRWSLLPALARLVRLARRHEVVLAGSEIGPGVVVA